MINEEIFTEVEKRYMPTVMEKVRAQAEIIASAAEHTEATYVDVFRAFEDIFSPAGKPEPEPQSANNFWRDNVFLIIVTGMTVVFGVMGLVPTLLPNAAVSYHPDSFLDIAKIFAGVVVGGAAGVAAEAAFRGGRQNKAGGGAR